MFCHYYDFKPFFSLKPNLVSQYCCWIAVLKKCVLTIKKITDVTDEIAIVSNFSRMIYQFFLNILWILCFIRNEINFYQFMYCVDRVKYLFCRILRKNSGNFGR